MSAKSFSLRNLRQSSAGDATLFNASTALTPFDHQELQRPQFLGAEVNSTDAKFPVSRAQSATVHSFSGPKSGLVELTKNSKYCVLKLPTSPVQLKNTSQDEYLTGSTDESTSYAMFTSSKGIYVWKYDLSEEIPQVFFFESSSSNPNASNTLGSLVSPIAGIKEPGLVTIVPETGIVTYWESVGGAFANELLQKKKQIVHQIKLHGSEYIDCIENIEPAGVVAITNVGRFILITFRDGTGKPILQSETMRTSGSGFLATIKDAVTLSGSRRGVVSIKPGKYIDRDERHAIAITSSCNLLIWDCFRTGQSRLLLEENLQEAMLDSISSLYPHANTTFTVHDVEYHNNADYVYVLGSSVNNKDTQEIAYFLFTFTLQQNVLNILTTHQFKTFTSPSSCRPQLLLPKPYNTLFVCFSDAVILTDAIPKSLNELSKVSRWEDTVMFLQGVEAFAFGKEDLVEVNKKVNRYPSIIAMTKQAGILRIERYTQEEEAEDNLSGTSQSQVTKFVKGFDFDIAKTKIEQAVFYGHREEFENPVDFEIRKELQLDPEVIRRAVTQVSSEILSSTSPYLPPILPALGDHLELRWEALNHMGQFLHQNFPNELNLNSKLVLLWDLEKLCAAKSLWEEYNNKLGEQENNTSAVNIFPEIIPSTTGNQNGDKVRSWFIHSIKDIPKLFMPASNYSAKHENSVNILEEVNNVLLTAISFSAYPTRAVFGSQYFGITEETVGSIEPWTGSSEVLSAFLQQYQQTVKALESFSKQDQHYTTLSEQLVHIVSALCHIYCDRIAWLKETEQPSKVAQTYKTTRDEWIHSLAKFGQKQEAQQIAEKYKLFKSLAILLGDDYRNEVNAKGVDTVLSLGIISKLQEYINTFGYDFAAVLFQYYVDTQQLKSLLKQFPQYYEYLERFLASGNNYGRFSWIHELLVDRTEQAAATLLDVATEKETIGSNKLLQLSIAKLSALASVQKQQQQNNSQSSKTVTLQHRINSQLELTEIHNFVRNQVLLRLNNAGDDISVYADQVSQSLKSHNLNQLRAVLRRILVRLAGNQPLTSNELVDILTLCDVDKSSTAAAAGTTTELSSNRLNFFLAFKLIHLTSCKLSASQIKLNEQIIWRRLFLQDDWASLDKTEKKADNIVEQRFARTVLYETLVHVFSEGLDQKLDMSFALNPEKAVWTDNDNQDNNTETKESELLARYPPVLDTMSSSSLTNSGALRNSQNSKGRFVLHDINMEGSLLKAQVKNYNLGKWAQGIYSQAERVADVVNNEAKGIYNNGNSNGGKYDEDTDGDDGMESSNDNENKNENCENMTETKRGLKRAGGFDFENKVVKKPLFVRNKSKDVDMEGGVNGNETPVSKENDEDVEMS